MSGVPVPDAGANRARVRSFRAVDAVLSILGGLIALGAAMAVVRSFGPRSRIERLLTAAPKVSVAEAIALARAGRAVYIRIDGRIDSEAEFEDADHRPLVLRRTRIQAQRNGRWEDLDIVREVVPFEIREGLDGIAVDGESVGDGLVVLPRESAGVVGDLHDRAPDDVPDELPARVILEQVSSVEHAIALGVPTMDPSGRPRLGPGRGRPLVLSTLEPEEARRILAGNLTARRRIAAALLLAAAVLVIFGIVAGLLPGDALALGASAEFGRRGVPLTLVL